MIFSKDLREVERELFSLRCLTRISATRSSGGCVFSEHVSLKEVVSALLEHLDLSVDDLGVKIKDNKK